MSCNKRQRELGQVPPLRGAPGAPATAPPVTQGPRTLHVRLGCEFHYQSAAGTEFIARIEPPPMGDHAVLLRADRIVMPVVPLRRSLDRFGNPCWRMTASGPQLTVRYDATFAMPEVFDEAPTTAVVQVPMCEVPDSVLEYTSPSRFCQSDLLMDEAWQLFGAVAEGTARVQAICDWVHTHVQYGYEGSSATTSATDTFASRQGVCRDFAHLPVAFCRALNIPARYAFGYLPDHGVVPPDVPMDFHAWFEAYLGGRWYTFDARHNVPRMGRIKVAHGRDAVDVAMITSYGMAILEEMTVWTDAALVTEHP